MSQLFSGRDREKIPFNLENFFNNAQPMTVQVRPLNLDDKAASVQEEYEVYLDGKRISSAEFRDLPTSNIESMSVDKSGKTTVINLTSKQMTSYNATASLSDEVVSYGTYRKEVAITNDNTSDDSGAKPKIDVKTDDNLAQISPKVKTDSSLSVKDVKDAEIYLDEKKISSTELEKIPNESIESISIDKSGNTRIIKISTKKKAKIKIHE